MREFFDRFDAGAYDRPFLVFLLVVLAASWLWDHVNHDKATKAFYAAQQRAQEAFSKLGPHAPETQFRVYEALECWRRWQHRPATDIGDVGCDTTEAEWHALSLLNSLPPDEPGQRVM